MGFAVYRVPEAATLTIMSGANPGQMDREQFVVFEENLLKLQIALERNFETLAQTNNKPSTVILYVPSIALLQALLTLFSGQLRPRDNGRCRLSHERRNGAGPRKEQPFGDGAA